MPLVLKEDSKNTVEGHPFGYEEIFKTFSESRTTLVKH